MRRALVILVLVPFAAGCGAQKHGALDNSSRAMADAGTSRVEMTLTQGKRVLFTGKGTIDYAHNRGDLVVRALGVANQGALSTAVFEARFIGSTTYMGWTLSGKKGWLKESESDSDRSGTDLFMPGPGGPSPDRVLALLFKSSKEVEVLGKDEIRGVSAKHYRAHIDTKKLDQFGDSIRNLVIDAWIDDNGLVRRLRLPESDEPPGITTVDFFDFGVEVDVEAPPANEILTEQEFEDLLFRQCKTMEGGGSGEGGICALVGDGGSSSSEVTP